MNRYEYRVIETFCGECGIATYGISVWLRQSGGNVEICSVKDVSSNKGTVHQLAERCQRVQLSPIHLMDVIEDFLP